MAALYHPLGPAVYTPPVSDTQKPDESQACLRLVRELARALPPSARISNVALREALGAGLLQHGFDVCVPFDTRRGRIDVLASRSGVQIAIDIEHAEIGTRAIKKLRPFPYLKVIVLRRPSRRPRRGYEPPPAGIHDIIEAPELAHWLIRSGHDA